MDHFLSLYGVCYNITSVFYLLFFFGWEACRILAPPTEIEPVPSALEGKVLITGPPGKTLSLWFWFAFS